MIQHFIATETFDHQIDCFCPGEKHEELMTILKGAVVEVTQERRFSEHKGWYVLIIVNQYCVFFIAAEELDKYVKEERLLSLIDIELKINFLQHQIDKTLDKVDKGTFIDTTNELKRVYDLKLHLENYIKKTPLRT